MAAEYVAAGGNHRIVLCERGIRTFETAYRNVLDVTAIPVAKRETHLPVIVDPSHAGGKAWMVPALACAAVAAGADGLLVEVHPCPQDAWCDADQALAPDAFDDLMRAPRSRWRSRSTGASRRAPRRRRSGGWRGSVRIGKSSLIAPRDERSPGPTLTSHHRPMVELERAREAPSARHGRGRDRRLAHRARRGLAPRRTLRQRQVHAAAPDRGADRADVRPHRRRRPGPRRNSRRARATAGADARSGSSRNGCT